MRTRSHTASLSAASAGMPKLFTTKYTDFAAYVVASGLLPYRGARIGEIDGRPCTVFCFEDAQNIGRTLIRQFFASKCGPIEPKALFAAHKFVRQEVARVRHAAEVQQ